MLDDILRLLPGLAELADGWKPSWDPQEVVETPEQEQQREEWAIIQTARELLEAVARGILYNGKGDLNDCE